MEVKKIRVHTCNQRLEGYITDKCRCRKFVTLAKAEQLKEDGYAAHVITGYTTIEVEEICPVCNSEDSLKKSCRLCSKTGKVLRKKSHFEYGEDLFMTSTLRTPRTATIEKNHIEYSVVRGDKDAAKRIELYHQLDQLALVNLGAELRDIKTGEVLLEGNKEPENDPKKGTGRLHDYGRTI